MTQAQRPASGDPVVDLNAQIGIISQRQDELAQVVEKLEGSVGKFRLLQTYVEQIAEILAGVVDEVAAHDMSMVEGRLDKLAKTAREVDKLRNEMHDVAELVQELATAKRPQAQKAVWWPDLPAGQARAEAMQSLGRWVNEVLRARHPEAYNELGTCWFLHPDILDELTALQAAWFAAYRDKASSGAAAIEWHDRWLPGAMARCREAMRARGCKGRHEKESRTTVAFLDRQEFKNFVRCGSEPVAPVPAPSPPWDPVTDLTSWRTPSRIRLPVPVSRSSIQRSESRLNWVSGGNADADADVRTHQDTSTP